MGMFFDGNPLMSVVAVGLIVLLQFALLAVRDWWMPD